MRNIHSQQNTALEPPLTACTHCWHNSLATIPPSADIDAACCCCRIPPSCTTTECSTTTAVLTTNDPALHYSHRLTPCNTINGALGGQKLPIPPKLPTSTSGGLMALPTQCNLGKHTQQQHTLHVLGVITQSRSRLLCKLPHVCATAPCYIQMAEPVCSALPQSSTHHTSHHANGTCSGTRLPLLSVGPTWVHAARGMTRLHTQPG